MSDSQRKLKDRASRAYADGRLRDALKLFNEVVEQDPTELQCQLKVGDIYRKLGEREAAVTAYIPVAKAYSDDGLILKAIAVCKMVLAVDTDHPEGRALLTQLHARRHGVDQARTPPAVTLGGMGMSPPAGQTNHPTLHEYGMVELDPGGEASAPSSWPETVRTLDPEDIGGEAEVPTDLQGNEPPRTAEPPAMVLDASGGLVPSAATDPGMLGTTTPPPAVMTPPEGTPRRQAVIPVVTGTPEAPPPPPSGPAPVAGAESASALGTSGPPDVPRPTSSAPPPPPPPSGPTSPAPKIVVGNKLQASMASGPIDPVEERTIEADIDDAIVETLEHTVEASVGEQTVQASIEPSGIIHADGPAPYETSEIVELTNPVEVSAVVELTNVITPASTPPPRRRNLNESDIWEAGGRDAIPSIPMEPAVEAPAHHQKAAEVPETSESLEGLGRSSIPLFSDLPKNAFIELLVQMDMHVLEPEHVIIQEGEEGDSFFVVASGQVKVQHKDRNGNDVVLAHLHDGAFFGEMALLQDGARTASVVAETECQIFELKREVLDRVVEKFPSVASVLKNFYKQRLLSTTMATHPLFRPFQPDERRRLMELFKSRNFAMGDLLLQEGKKGTGLFLVLYGTLEVAKDREGIEQVLAELGPGDMFGEMSLLTNQPTVATIRAVTDCFVMRLSKRKFDEIIMTHPQILELVGTLSAERAEQNEVLLRSHSPFGTGAVLV